MDLRSNTTDLTSSTMDLTLNRMDLISNTMYLRSILTEERSNQMDVLKDRYWLFVLRCSHVLSKIISTFFILKAQNSLLTPPLRVFFARKPY